MRKKLFILALMVFFISGMAFAASEWCRYSASNDASALITTGNGLFHGIILSTDGVTSQTLNIYDFGTNDAGCTTTELPMIPTDYKVTSSATDRVQSIGFNPAVRYHHGLYVTLASSSVEYTVYYESQ